jgi:hypothetical protein
MKENLKLRKYTDMIDEIKKDNFTSQNYDYGIIKKVSNKNITINAP